MYLVLLIAVSIIWQIKRMPMENKRQIFQKTGFSIQCQCKQFILVHRFPFHFFFAHFAEASMLLTDYRLQRDDDH